MHALFGGARPALRRLSRTAGVLLLSACVGGQPYTRPQGDEETRTVANLARAAKLPWTDQGQCVVQNASLSWPEIAERCYDALDLERIRFRDTEGRCAVSQAGALAIPIARAVGICLIAQPELLVGVVIVVGVVATAVLIKEALARREVYTEEDVQRRAGKPTLSPRPTFSPTPPPTPEPSAQPRKTGPDVTSEPPTSTRPECRIQPVCPRPVKDKAHDDCADDFPPNQFPGCDVMLGGKRFDALQVGTRRLWEIKVYNFDAYSPFVQRAAVLKDMEELRRERDLARACGYEFVVGVSSKAHKAALEDEEATLKIVVTGCVR